MFVYVCDCVCFFFFLCFFFQAEDGIRDLVRSRGLGDVYKRQDLSADMMEIWDDCMCFPNLLVQVMRHKSLTINYLNENWQPQSWSMTDDLSELLQHEYDHLEGILCTMTVSYTHLTLPTSDLV